MHYTEKTEMTPAERRIYEQMLGQMLEFPRNETYKLDNYTEGRRAVQ
jgi:hypothetical protein